MRAAREFPADISRCLRHADVDVITGHWLKYPDLHFEKVNARVEGIHTFCRANIQY